MKITIAIPFLFLLAISTSNCTPDNEFIPSTEETLTKNGWGVDYFFQQQDMTSEFSDYYITFRPSGAINCRIGNEVITGTWNRIVNPDQSELIDISIATSNQILNKLNGSWSLKFKTSIIITFEDYQLQSGCMMRIKIKR